tara:strand:- start:386 stop:685 length:300 start_codon:yes stop_codon:yes gene_type:complete
MVYKIQKYLALTFNISIDILKGKKTPRCEQDYKIYNLSILLCWILHPTQVYGSKSLIARHHRCSKNRVYRLDRFYKKNDNFKSFVDKHTEEYKRNYASD